MSGSRISPWWVAKVGLGGALLVYAVAVLLDWVPRTVALPHARTPGQVLAMLGGGITLTHYAILKRRTRNLSRPAALETEVGLYRFVRHPMYLGDTLLYAGFAWLACDALALAVLVLAMVSIVALCRVEDAAMAARFGSAFDQWRERTGLLVPRLT